MSITIDKKSTSPSLLRRLRVGNALAALLQEAGRELLDPLRVDLLGLDERRVRVATPSDLTRLHPDTSHTIGSAAGRWRA
jgi:hypothetical protein